jgi:hypothetical protein
MAVLRVFISRFNKKFNILSSTNTIRFALPRKYAVTGFQEDPLNFNKEGRN